MFAHKLYFLRHGETFYNAEGRIQGQLDTPLAPRGREQAVEAGRTLAAVFREDGVDPGGLAWRCSPLTRALDTMILARAEMGLADGGFSTDDRLKEISFGRWQNLTWPEIRAGDPGLALQRDRDIWDFAPPDGESYAQLTARVGGWLAELAGPTVAVAHGGVARALMVLAGGVAPAEAVRMPVHQGRALVFSGGAGRWTEPYSRAVQPAGGIGPSADLC